MAQDILIIDDEADIRDLVSGILEDDGHQVRAARDSDEALDAFKRRKPSLVVLDVSAEGPAGRAGVLVGDLVLAIDGKPIDSPEELMDLLLTIGAGHQATLRLLRGTVSVDVPVAVGERP